MAISPVFSTILHGYWHSDFSFCILLFLYLTSATVVYSLGTIFCFYKAFTDASFIILADDKLVFQNSVFPFLRKRVMYKDIKSVQLILKLGYRTLKVIRVGGKKDIRYIIGTVHPDACEYMLKVLQAKGMFVEKISIG